MKRSKFSLSNYKLFSCDMGSLVPCGMLEVLPGDSIQQATSALVRLAPLLSPVMHPVEVRIHHWFVPHRLTWENWEPFITGGPDGMDASAFPTIELDDPFNTIGSLADYLGVPTGTDNLVVSALPFRAYGLIWNEWYRDQDLVTEAVVSVADGADTTTNKSLAPACWEKDYFTSARPWEQKGPAITIPLGDTAPVVGIAGDISFGNSVDATLRTLQTQTGGPGGTGDVTTATAPSGTGSARWGATQLEADLTGVSAVIVNVLREAMALQRYEEARARFGSRYTEYLRYLGVKSSDARLQRPEYLGGGRQTIQFSEVLQTAEGADPVGQMAGHGLSAMRSNRYRRFFEEHGYVMTLMSVRPKTIYAQGLPRTWNRRTKEDFWQQELQHIGQQEVLNKEIYAAGASPEATFGFQDRYDEYRRQESTIAGEFRDSTLDYWHMARIFASAPALNASFVLSVPTERIFASSENHVMYIMAKHSVQARRLVAQTGSSFIY